MRETEKKEINVTIAEEMERCNEIEHFEKRLATHVLDGKHRKGRAKNL